MSVRNGDKARTNLQKRRHILQRAKDRAKQASKPPAAEAPDRERPKASR